MTAPDQLGDLAPDADRRAPDQLPGPGDAAEETADHEDRDGVHVPRVSRISDQADALDHLGDEQEREPEADEDITEGSRRQVEKAGQPQEDRRNEQETGRGD